MPSGKDGHDHGPWLSGVRVVIVFATSNIIIVIIIFIIDNVIFIICY